MSQKKVFVVVIMGKMYEHVLLFRLTKVQIYSSYLKSTTASKCKRRNEQFFWL